MFVGDILSGITLNVTTKHRWDAEANVADCNRVEKYVGQARIFLLTSDECGISA